MDALSSNRNFTILLGIVGLVLAILSFLGLSLIDGRSAKERRARNLRNAYDLMRSDSKSEKIDGENTINSTLEVGELWIYPIKSLRGVRVQTALVTPEGFYLDRRYMLLKVGDETNPKIQSMHIPHHPSMGLFQASIPQDSSSVFTISFHPPNSPPKEFIRIPFVPSQRELDRLDTVEVDMYGSACLAYNMGSLYNDWFSSRFGFKVILAFWGGNARPVLGNIPGRPKGEIPKEKSVWRTKLESLPVVGPMIGKDIGIAFNDMASFLVINEASVREVSSRIDQKMDASKFRPNVIVTGSDTAFEEDYWAELTVNPGHPTNQCNISLTANCVRCQSLNVDYETGAPAQGKAGEVLKLLQKDRRVDTGMKYSPVFGRYGFPGKNDEGKILRVGDKIKLSMKNEERTTFVWRGITDT